jgi:hypothetical protein
VPGIVSRRRGPGNDNISTGLITWKRAVTVVHVVFTRTASRLDTFEARIPRAKSEGFACGSREGKLFGFAVGKVDLMRDQVHGWLNTVVDDGRAKLESQHALEREVEAWDMSCRIAFMIEIADRPRSSGDRQRRCLANLGAHLGDLLAVTFSPRIGRHLSSPVSAGRVTGATPLTYPKGASARLLRC